MDYWLGRVLGVQGSTVLSSPSAPPKQPWMACKWVGMADSIQVCFWNQAIGSHLLTSVLMVTFNPTSRNGPFPQRSSKDPSGVSQCPPEKKRASWESSEDRICRPRVQHPIGYPWGLLPHPFSPGSQVCSHFPNGRAPSLCRPRMGDGLVHLSVLHDATASLLSSACSVLLGVDHEGCSHRAPLLFCFPLSLVSGRLWKETCMWED